jgi:hypothetical protein
LLRSILLFIIPCEGAVDLAPPRLELYKAGGRPRIAHTRYIILSIEVSRRVLQPLQSPSSLDLEPQYTLRRWNSIFHVGQSRLLTWLYRSIRTQYLQDVRIHKELLHIYFVHGPRSPLLRHLGRWQEGPSMFKRSPRTVYRGARPLSVVPFITLRLQSDQDYA